MRDFAFPWGLTFGLVMYLLTELPTASGPKSTRVYCGYGLGPTRVTPPSRQDDGDVRAPALSRAVCVVVQVVAVGRVRWLSFYSQLSVSAHINSPFSIAPRTTVYPGRKLISILLMRIANISGQHSRVVSSPETSLGAFRKRSKKKVCEKLRTSISPCEPGLFL